MTNYFYSIIFFLIILLIPGKIYPQSLIESGDPPNNTNIPTFFKSGLSDIESEIANVKKGKVKVIATSPGGLPVYVAYYGEKNNFNPRANYNSAVAAGNPAFYARKTKETKPVVLFLGPVHGHEIEGIVGLVNLIHIAETGKDYRGKEWPIVKEYFNKCRIIIIPCANPDGRKRCPYDSFIGLPVEIMTKYGQGTRLNGTSWGWPQAKSLHPMKGNVGILGAYFNDNGINMMHDDFFSPMAEETKAILKVARDEAPDMTVSLHSYELPPSILQPAYIPFFMMERVAGLANHLNEHYKKVGLPAMPEGWKSVPVIEDEHSPVSTSFNLVSALYHISGTMAFTFECCHGTKNLMKKTSNVSYGEILDVELTMYQEVLKYTLNNRLLWNNTRNQTE